MGELSICTRVAELYPKNYFAWSHRQFVIQDILAKNSNAPIQLVIPLVSQAIHETLLQSSDIPPPSTLLATEIKLLCRWTDRHGILQATHACLTVPRNMISCIFILNAKQCRITVDFIIARSFCWHIRIRVCIARLNCHIKFGQDLSATDLGKPIFCLCCCR